MQPHLHLAQEIGVLLIILPRYWLTLLLTIIISSVITVALEYYVCNPLSLFLSSFCFISYLFSTDGGPTLPPIIKTVSYNIVKIITIVTIMMR